MLFTTFRSTKTIDQLFYCILYRFLHSVQKLYNILLHIVTNLQCSETTRRGAWLALFTQSIQRLLCLNLELDGGCYKSTRRTVTPATDDNRVRGRWSWKPTNERTVYVPSSQINNQPGRIKTVLFQSKTGALGESTR